MSDAENKKAHKKRDYFIDLESKKEIQAKPNEGVQRVVIAVNEAHVSGLDREGNRCDFWKSAAS